MTVVKTDLRLTRERAQQLRFYPIAGVAATNVQDAIEETYAAAIAPPSYTPTVVTFAMSPYAPGVGDSVLLVDTTGGPVVISMPLSAARLGRPLTVKDDVGNSDVNAIAINRAGAELIDGATSVPIDSKYFSVTLQPKTAGGYDVV